ncbi:MAG TPA: ABC transporter ATP-binding protein [Chloroflexota bacterium]|nr:ABC transporter ATP-binding protein [Chloroflexota bacterium]
MLIRRSRPTNVAQGVAGFRRIMRQIGPRLRVHRLAIAAAMLSLVGATLMRLLEPWPLQLVVDHVIGATPTKGLPTFLGQLTDMQLLAISAGAVLLVVGLRALLEYASTIGFALIGSRVLADVRQDLYRHLQRLSLAFHSQARAGDLTMRMMGDIGMMRDVAVTALLPLAANVLILIGMAAVMAWLDWRLALIALLPLPLLSFTTIRLTRNLQSVSRKQRGREGDMAATVSESMAGVRSVQALSLEERTASFFGSQEEGALKQGVKAKRLAAALERSTDVLVGISTALVLWYGTVLVLREALSVGELLVFLAYLKNAFKPVRDFSKHAGRLAKATAAGERVVDLLEQVPDVRDLPGAVAAPRFSGWVQFEDVHFRYADGKQVLSGIQLAVQPGKVVAVVGPSGAGKSTIASLLLRLQDPTGGRILIDGQDIRDFKVETVRAQMSVVLQDTLVLSGTVAENISLANPEATQAEIEEAARLAGAHGFISELPNGYDTVVAERGGSLSNGQRQRLALARAALRESPILIVDEPTTGLDRENERIVIEALRRLSANRAVLLITHDLDFAATVDEIAYIEGGRVVETGSHDELMSRNGHYARLFTARRIEGGQGLHAVAS